MHLLLAQKGTIADGKEAIDLGQTPGDILFLSAADTELASIAAAHHARKTATRLRLASLATLSHPMSVDTYIERTARHAKLIVIRALGGASYFRYVLEALLATSFANDIKLVALPGDDRPDEGLIAFNRIDTADRERLWAYLNEGGAENADRFLAYADAVALSGEKPEPAVPLEKAGIWWPGRGVVDVGGWRELAGEDAPTAAICFYRAYVQSGETRPVEMLIEALAAEGVRALPLFVSSLKEPVSIGTVRAAFAEIRPEVVLNTTSFAVSAPGAGRKPTVLDETGAPVLQAIFSGSSREAWEASGQGLTARDLGMNVSLPEVDGRVLSRAISFKAAARYDERVETNIVSLDPVEDRIRFVAKLATGWARLRRAEPAERRIALIMANYPNRDGRLGNGVGLD
ncbi:cobaltochelatase subunit CobN, partial [Shinella sp.]|uniref:cobaltochelatase subunit CobN n=1 Tax=Shinella sp. TaxID=1870904 RepID=UPI0039183622